MDEPLTYSELLDRALDTLKNSSDPDNIAEFDRLIGIRAGLIERELRWQREDFTFRRAVEAAEECARRGIQLPEWAAEELRSVSPEAEGRLADELSVATRSSSRE